MRRLLVLVVVVVGVGVSGGCGSAAATAHHTRGGGRGVTPPAQPALRTDYPVHPTLRWATGGPITVTGAVAHPGEIPYSRGLTFTAALRLAGGQTVDAAVRLDRKSKPTAVEPERFAVPVAAILAGTKPDFELAPGDLLVFEPPQIEFDE